MVSISKHIPSLKQALKTLATRYLTIINIFLIMHSFYYTFTPELKNTKYIFSLALDELIM